MAATDRLYDRGTRLGERRLRDLGEEYRNRRTELGLSQLRVAQSARISRSTYSRIERGKYPSLTLLVAARVGVVLGLDLVVRSYQGGDGLRDAASASGIKLVIENVSRPLRWKTEVPLPQRGDYPEQRRWDVMLSGSGKRTALEFEARLYDAQAQHGRWNLKMRDDPVDAFVLVVADTRRNREVLARFGSLFAEFPRLRSAAFLGMLRCGEHPPSGLVLLPSVRHEHHPDDLSQAGGPTPNDHGESVSEQAPD